MRGRQGSWADGQMGSQVAGQSARQSGIMGESARRRLLRNFSGLLTGIDCINISIGPDVKLGN